jgi:REP element-mobilizing transposase RayT
MKALRTSTELRDGFIPTESKGDFIMTYWRLHYHIIWSTMDRRPILTPQVEKLFYGVIHRKADELGLKMHAVGNVEDHVHIVVSIPPKLSVAECVRHLKGASAYAINHMDGGDGQFKWQAGYGALTVSDSALKRVMEYASRQKEHHAGRRTIDVYEKIEEEE